MVLYIKKSVEKNEIIYNVQKGCILKLYHEFLRHLFSNKVIF